MDVCVAVGVGVVWRLCVVVRQASCVGGGEGWWR